MERVNKVYRRHI